MIGQIGNRKTSKYILRDVDSPGVFEFSQVSDDLWFCRGRSPNDDIFLDGLLFNLFFKPVEVKTEDTQTLPGHQKGCITPNCICVNEVGIHGPEVVEVKSVEKDS